MNKLIVIVSAVTCLIFTTAAVAAELPQEILLCRAIVDPLERAQCYDGAVDALQPPNEAVAVVVEADEPAAVSQPTPTIDPTLSIIATPAEPEQQQEAEVEVEVEVDELKQQVAELEQQVAVLKNEKGTESLSSEDLFGRDDTETRKSLMEMFGLGGDVEQIQATLAEIKRSPYGKLVMVLDNGQIWTQTDSSRLNVKPGDGVVIKSGMLGSFLLEKQTGSLSIRVKRID